MKYPASIKIGFLDYAVVEVAAANMPGADGHFRMGSGQITLADDMPPAYAVKVLLHEIFHGIYDHGAMQNGSLTEERIVDTFAVGLATVIRDNPGFAKWLADNLEAK